MAISMSASSASLPITTASAAGASTMPPRRCSRYWAEDEWDCFKGIILLSILFQPFW